MLEKPKSQLPLIVGISGATGSIYGVRILEMLRSVGVESHLVLSKAGEVTLHQETDLTGRDLRELATKSYLVADIGAAIASGSFQTAGMIIAPCSIKSLSSIAHGISDNLLTRAADVTLKERRKLVLMVRETPLNLIHINAMKAVTEAGAIVAPPVPAFYSRPSTLDDLIDHTAARALDLFDIDLGDRLTRWQGLRGKS